MSEFWERFVTGFAIWVPSMVVIMPILEYVSHRWFMHRENRFNPGGVKKHLLHHTGRDYPVGEMIDLRYSDYLYFACPFFACFIFAGVWFDRPESFAGGVTLAISLFLHSYIYTKVHRRIHEIERANFTDRIPWIARLHRHHLMHHAIGGAGNYGVTCTWTDRLFRTHTRPR
jgi:sterol desaturase/sphingolipid hydroxylase (fatty acid hydroxylase superfamily)